jgi:putative ABC transport system permease protein
MSRVTQLSALLARLAWRNVRHRPVAAILLLIAMTTVTTTLSLALVVQSTAQRPWDATFDRTSGAHVVANSEDPARLAALVNAPGVIASIGPNPVIPTTAVVAGFTVPLEVVGRETLDSAVDRPIITAGSADLSGSSIVLERSTASTIHAAVGDRVLMQGGTELTLTGIAVSVASPPFPRSEPGHAWTSTATAAQLAGATGRYVQQVELRLADPASAPAFVASHADPRLYLVSWQQTRDSALQDIATIRIILLTVSLLLIILTLGSVTTLVAARMNERLRQFGILKALGATPALLTVMVLIEQLASAAVATVVGVATGAWLAGLITRPVAILLNSATPTGPTPGSWLAVAAAATAIVLVAATRPALAAARATTLSNLTAGLGRPRSTQSLARVAAALRIALPVSLGVRSMVRRPSRTLLAIGSLALSVALVAAALATERTLKIQQHATATSDNNPAAVLQAMADQAASAQIERVVGLFAVVFAVLGAVNLLIIATYAARDSARNHAILRSLGFTPAQTGTSLLSAQIASALAAVILGIPFGLGLFRAIYKFTNNSPFPASDPTALSLALLGAVAVGATGLLAAGPAWLLARRPVSTTLTVE